MNQRLTFFMFIVAMICLAPSAIAKSPLWSIATDDAQKHVFLLNNALATAIRREPEASISV